MTAPVDVHVWSDIACPWCFIGKRRLERAVADTGIDVRVHYHSYQLSPDTPADFAGSEVDFLDGVLTTNTGLAHQALHHARAHGRQADLVERLSVAHFEEGRHVGRVEDLVALGEDVGLGGAELRAALESGRYADAVTQDVAAARAIGVAGVPFFVLDQRYGISGAQSPEVFAGALQRVLEDRAEPPRVTAEG